MYPDHNYYTPASDPLPDDVHKWVQTQKQL